MNDKIKVLHIITRLDKGGSAENTFLTTTGQDKSIFDVTVMSGPVEDPAQDRRDQLEESGVRYIHIRELVRNINALKDLVAFFKIFRFLGKNKFDIVHTHTSKAGLLGRLAARLARTRVILHTPHGHVFFDYFGSLKTRLFIYLEKRASRITDRIISLTDREKQDYITYKIADEDKLVTIFSGIELERFQQLSDTQKNNLKRELGIPWNSLVIGSLGRLVHVKGLEYLIEASKHIHSRHPNTSFVFTGDGPLKKRLITKAQKLGLAKNTFFIGWQENVSQILSIYDIFVLPSLNEGMGRVLAEAMALEKPIVASDIGGIPDLVVHGKNGFLVPPKNPVKLAEYIQILIEDQVKREDMGKAGKEMAAGFRHEIMVRKITDLYNELMAVKAIYY